jgi:aryl-alcohol dehydrogenase-like predicted oxidoreductase
VAGHALSYLVGELGYSRNNFLLSSKAGYVRENLPSTVASTEVINDHCVHPHFLKAELELSLKNFGVETLDVYYLNNFA